MILKLVDSCVIVLTSTLIGFEAAKRYVMRTRELRAFQSALSRLETEILHYSSLLPEAMLQIGGSIGGGTGKVFIRTGKLLAGKKNYSVSEAWSSSLQLVPNCSPNRLKISISSFSRNNSAFRHCREELQASETE